MTQRVKDASAQQDGKAVKTAEYRTAVWVKI